MKPTNFFIEKAESFLEQLGSMKLIPFDLGAATDDIYKDPLEASNKEFSEQSDELKEIKFQMNLMFQEFDKGQLFEKKLNSFKSPLLFNNEPFLNHLIKINTLFIDFLNDYRVEKKDK